MNTSIRTHLRNFWSWLFGDGLGVVTLFFIVVAAGLFGLWLADEMETGHEVLRPWAPRLRQIAAILVTAASVQLLLRSWLWKKTEASFFEKLKIKNSLITSGFVDFWWFPEVPWRDLFEGSQSVRILVISARFLLVGDKIGLVRDFLRKKDNKLTVVFLDPEDALATRKIDKQFHQTQGTRQRNNQEILNQLRALQREPEVRGQIEVRITSGEFKYSCYQFDSQYLYVPYLVEPEVRAPERIPVLKFSNGEFVQKYLEGDLNYIFTRGSKLVDLQASTDSANIK